MKTNKKKTLSHSHGAQCQLRNIPYYYIFRRWDLVQTNVLPFLKYRY
ncbi:UNVERIFIED_CONTAM: hypothetical protein ABID98_000915 [Brevibacillus sp. OAP136]